MHAVGACINTTLKVSKVKTFYESSDVVDKPSKAENLHRFDSFCAINYDAKQGRDQYLLSRVNFRPCLMLLPLRTYNKSTKLQMKTTSECFYMLPVN